MVWQIATLAILGLGNYFGPSALGVPVNVYSNDPAVRMEQMLIDSENLRPINNEWRRWRLEQPSHLTPYRIHGGVGPKSSSI